MIIFVFDLENNTYSVEAYFCISIFVTLAHAADNLKSLNHEINLEKKMEPRNTHEIDCLKIVHIRSYSTPYFTAFGLNLERYRVSLRIQSECGKTRAITLEKKFEPTKYPREMISDSRNIHEKNFWTQKTPTKARWLDGTKPTRLTIAREHKI